MPLSGTLDVSGRDAPVVDRLATEPVTLENAQLLYAMFEVDAADMEDLIPPALNPTIPPVVTFVALSASGSPIGSFTYVQARIGCRAGVRPRGFVTGGYISGDDSAARALVSRWGFALKSADVSLARHYDDVVAEVSLDGTSILRVKAVDPIPLTGGEVLFASNMQLARVQHNGSEQVSLVQMDPEMTFHKAARGAARLDVFDVAAWGEPRLRVTNPVSAWHASCDFTLPRVRYICDPELPALQGTEKVG